MNVFLRHTHTGEGEIMHAILVFRFAVATTGEKTPSIFFSKKTLTCKFTRHGFANAHNLF